MKNMIAVLTAFALFGFAVPAFACDGHKADKEETTTTSTEKADGHECSSDCDHSDKKKKKAKAETEESKGDA